MAAIQIELEKFKYDQDTAHVDWPIHMHSFENYLELNNVDVTQVAGAARAKQLLINSGGRKVMEIYTNIPNRVALTYAQLLVALNNRFRIENNRLNILEFRNCKQRTNEILEDYITRLTNLAINAGVLVADQPMEILNVIATHAYNERTQQKAINHDMTLGNLRIWARGQEIQEKCLKLVTGVKTTTPINNVTAVMVKNPMENNQQKNNHHINNVNNNPNQQDCYNCGYNWPHEPGRPCPAENEICKRCLKPGHFANKCMRGIEKRPQRTIYTEEARNRPYSPYTSLQQGTRRNFDSPRRQDSPQARRYRSPPPAAEYKSPRNQQDREFKQRNVFRLREDESINEDDQDENRLTESTQFTIHQD